MTRVRPTGDWDGAAFAHEGFVFDSDEAVAQRCVPFAREGLERDEPVLVVASDGVREVLTDELGADTDRLALLAPAETWWQGGQETLRAYDRDLRVLQAAGRPWRLIAEPVWLARDDGRRWSRYEAVANLCYPRMRYYSLCLHDRRLLDGETVEAVLRTHPLVWDGNGPEASPTYESTADFLRSVEPAWDLPAADVSTVRVRDARAAREHVRAVTEAIPGARVSDWAVDNVVLAVHELVANALRAAGEATLSSWTSDGRAVWEVSDSGAGFHDRTAGYAPPDETNLLGGRGLWLARRLADDATVREGGPGTAIRLYFRF